MQTAVKGLLRIKTEDYSFVDEICTVYCSDMSETFCASPERNVLSTR